MSRIKKTITVTFWEYRRFYKLKNELLGIAVMLFGGLIGYSAAKYAISSSDKAQILYVAEAGDPQLHQAISSHFTIRKIEQDRVSILLENIKNGEKHYFLEEGNPYRLHGAKKPKKLTTLMESLNTHQQTKKIEASGIAAEKFSKIFAPVAFEENYYSEKRHSERRMMALVFSILMLMGVFLSFAYQFTAITGEKQLKITEQIVSAIKPQVWMDGKILGITLTGLSSIASYTLMSIIGGAIYFLFTGKAFTNVFAYLHFPSLLLFLMFALLGILFWNAILAAIAAVITDPNNSGKSSLMLLPALLVLISFLVLFDPDGGFSVFLSYLPLTSASAMPVRWAVTDVAAWEWLLSFIILAITFWLTRRLAGKIFHVSILISGKEPTWKEVFRLMKEA
jgi:ABC-2 type transport system permease protein